MNEGNLNKWEGEGSIGLISSKITLQGPLSKGKTSVLLSARRTYIDLIARPIIKAAAKQDGVEVKPQLYFYDLNFKLQHRLNEKHRLYASFYSGSDRFFFTGQHHLSPALELATLPQALCQYHPHLQRLHHRHRIGNQRDLSQ